MTPTDALIEKMARAIAVYAYGLYGSYFDSGAACRLWEHVPDGAKDSYRSMARAAYSAEHEEDGK